MEHYQNIPEAPLAVLQTAINPQAQLIVTTLWAAMCLLVVGMLVKDFRRYRSWVPTFMILGCALGLFFEPMWDHIFQLVHYAPGQWTVWSAFGIPQPLWIAACYLSGFAAFPLVFLRKITKGDSMSTFVPWIIFTLLSYIAVEVIMIQIGLYEYWGAHPLRIGGYPAYICFGNACGVFFTALGAAIIEKHENSPTLQALASLMLFPLCFNAATYVAAMPVLIVLSRQTQVNGASYAGALLSILLGSLMIVFFLRCLSRRAGQHSSA